MASLSHFLNRGGLLLSTSSTASSHRLKSSFISLTKQFNHFTNVYRYCTTTPTRTSKSDLANALFKTFIDKELDKVTHTPNKDKALVDSYLFKYQFEIDPARPNLLRREKHGEEVVIDIDPDATLDPLIRDLQAPGKFAAHITKENTKISFHCEYTSSREYKIKYIRAEELRAEEGKEKRVKTLLTASLENSSSNEFMAFLQSRVPSTTPLIIDILLNIRDDKEYILFLSITSRLFPKPSKDTVVQQSV